MRLCAGWPDRLFLVDGNGRVACKTTPGPFGFDPAGLESALRNMFSGV